MNMEQNASLKGGSAWISEKFQSMIRLVLHSIDLKGAWVMDLNVEHLSDTN